MDENIKNFLHDRIRHANFFVTNLRVVEDVARLCNFHHLASEANQIIEQVRPLFDKMNKISQKLNLYMEDMETGYIHEDRLQQELLVKLMRLKLDGETIQAIKLYRDATGKTLKESKDFIDNLHINLDNNEDDDDELNIPF